MHLASKNKLGVLTMAAALAAASMVGICCVKPSQPAAPKISGNAGVAATSSDPKSGDSRDVTPAAKGPGEPSHPELFEGYALERPDETLELPKVLREVSGLTDVSDVEVACVQDEEGTIFIYHLDEKRIVAKIPFAGAGDYEGLTRVEGTFFVLRSDGALFEVADYASPSPRVSMTALRMPTRDNEGLCYDQAEQRLLISPKSRLGKSDEDRQTQGLFAYDLKTRQAGPHPSIILDLSAVIDGREKVRETKRGRNRVLPSRFLPSSVTVHPDTGELFVISAVARNLAVFTRKGELKSQHPLDAQLFPQPEGITFLPNRELVVANEGVNGKGTLLRFRPRQ
jgi:hypothetical protein